MRTKTSGRQRVGANRPSLVRGAVGLAFVTVAGGVLLPGCTESAPEIPKAEVKTVEAYGLTLGPDASPQEVAYVLLRSVTDDYAAARSGKHEDEEKAQRLTYSLAAVQAIEHRLIDTHNRLQAGAKQTDLGTQRDEKLWKIVHYWAPIVGHYVPSFPADLDEARARMWVSMDAAMQEAHVYLSAEHDPAIADAAKKGTTTIDIEMVREQVGGQGYWRVLRVDFLGRNFKAPKALRVVEAYGTKLDSGADPRQVAYVVLRTLADAVAAKKDEARDKGASAGYRLMTLADGAGIRVAVRSAADGDTMGAAKSVDEAIVRAVDRWMYAVPVDLDLASEAADAATGKMQVAEVGADPRTVDVTVLPGPLKVRLVERKESDRAFWRVLDVSGGPTTAPATAAK